MLQEELITIKKSMYTRSTSSTTILLLIIVIVAAIVVIIYLRNKGVKLFKTKTKDETMFEEAALIRGIPKSTVNVLLETIKFVPIKSPVLLFSSKNNFETYLIKTIIALRSQNNVIGKEELERMKNVIFGLLSNLDSYFKDSKKNVSSRDIQTGKKVRIYIKDMGYFFTEVIATLDKGFVIKKPSIEKEPRSWKLPVTVYFWRENDAGYSFESFIEDEVNESLIQGLFIRHSDNLLRYQKRQYIRKQCKFYATYSLIEIILDSEGKKKMKVVPPEYDGTIFDIGGGGFAMEVGTKLPVKRLIKINLFIGRQNVKAVAEIIRYEISPNNKFYMHCRFAKIPVIDQNIIYEFVYSRLIK
ncbi:MAG TPA: PilZ domain-containing protein [Exilispira sp.]|nr:PilZ domain-containing protein [Exilispira sp.]